MNVKFCVMMVFTLVVMCVISGCGTKSKPVENVKPSEPVLVQQSPVAVPMQATVDDGELRQLRDECERVKRELAEVTERAVMLRVENEKAESRIVTLAEQVRQAEAKTEKLAGKYEARTGSLHSWLTVVSITGVVMFFVGISLGSCTRRAFYAADREGGRDESEEE